MPHKVNFNGQLGVLVLPDGKEREGVWTYTETEAECGLSFAKPHISYMGRIRRVGFFFKQ